jgi:hypothetical protein
MHVGSDTPRRRLWIYACLRQFGDSYQWHTLYYKYGILYRNQLCGTHFFYLQLFGGNNFCLQLIFAFQRKQKSRTSVSSGLRVLQ